MNRLERLRLKIVFITEFYYPFMSGVPVVTKYLAEGLAEKGHEIHIVTKLLSNCKREEKVGSVKIHRFDVVYNKLKKPTGEGKLIKEFVLSKTWDVVIFECSQCVTTDIFLSELSNIDAVRVLHSHGFAGLLYKPLDMSNGFVRMLKNTYKSYIWRQYYSGVFKDSVKHFDITICLSEADSSKLYLKNNAIHEPKILLNCAQDIFFQDNTAKHAIRKYWDLENESYFVSVANYQEYKNQMGILEQFYLTETKESSIVFIGSEKTNYYHCLNEKKKELDRKYGKRDVCFLVGVDRNDIPSIITDAKIYLVGSTFEEFSISIIEAMASGTPFISTNVGNARLLPGGITIDSIDAMHGKIDLLTNDNSLYKNFVLKGQEYAYSHCRINHAVDLLEQWLLDAVNLRKK